MQSPIADEIVTLVDQIITIQGQISEHFPQLFENIVKENLAKNITSSLNNIYQTQSLALQNLREIEDLETKIIYFRILYDTNLPMPKDKYVYPVPRQEQNEIVSAQTQNDEIDENPENETNVVFGMSVLYIYMALPLILCYPGECITNHFLKKSCEFNI